MRARLFLATLLLCLILGILLWSFGILRTNGKPPVANTQKPTLPERAEVEAPGMNESLLVTVQTAPNEQVTGCVVDEAGKPVASALVCCALSSRAREILKALGIQDAASETTCETTENGSFSFAVRYSGVRYRLEAQAKGYRPNARTIAAGTGEAQNVELVLLQSSGVSGQVVDSNGRPVPHAVVVARKQGTGDRSESKPTGNTGAFIIDGLTPEVEYALVVRLSSPGLQVANAPVGLEITPSGNPSVMLEPGVMQENLRLVLTTDVAHRIRGIVLDETGKPIQGVEISGSLNDGRFLGPAFSDVDGRFDMGHIPSKYISTDLRLTHEAYESVRIPDTPVGGTDLTITMLPARQGAIVGQVLDAHTRKPVPEARVVLKWVSRNDSQLTFEAKDPAVWERIRSGSDDGSVNGDGEFRIENVPTGKAELVTYASEYGLDAQTEVDVRQGQETFVEILLNPPGTLHVDVILDGDRLRAPIEGCGVWCRPVDSDDSSFTITDSLARVLNGEPRMEYPLRNAPEWKLRLQPGKYDVIMGIRSPFYDIDRSLPKPSASMAMGNAILQEHVEAVIESGGETRVTFDAGGHGWISGIVELAEEERASSMFLIPGSISPSDLSDPSLYRDEEFSNGGSARLVTRYGRAYYLPLGGCRRYFFNSLPEGSYTLICVIHHTGGSLHVRNSEEIQVEADRETIADVLCKY